MQNYHGIAVKFMGPTDFNPSRVAIKSLRFGSKLIVQIDADDYVSQAINTLNEKGFYIVGQVEDRGKGMILLTDKFEPF